MSDRWYEKAVIYCLDVDTFQDSNGDGIGDLRGLIGRLDYLARLGVTCLWLNPIHPVARTATTATTSPTSTASHPRLGTLGDFAELLHQAGNRGHPGHHRPGREPHLRRAPVVPVGALVARTRRTATGTSGPTTEPPDRRQGMVFPGEQNETWTLRPDAPKPGTTTASTTSSPTSTSPTRRSARRSRRSCAFWLQLGRRRLPDGRGAVRHRADRAGQPRPAQGLRLPDRAAPARCSGARGDAVAAGRGERRARRSCCEYFGDAGGSATACPCCSTSCSTAG